MDPKISDLKQLIASKVFVRNSVQQIDIHDNPNAWIFDFRRILMNGMYADLISEIFYEKFKDRYPFQLCTLEVAGIPLLTSLMTKFYNKGHRDINAFFIRKSRKKHGLLQMVEGDIRDNTKIILIDDIINSGDSFWRQVTVLEELGHNIDTAWSILRFRDLDYYERFTEKDIRIESLFTLNDFTETLNVKNLLKKEEKPSMPFEVQWVFTSENPSLSYVNPKSQPILDDTRIYFGSDNRIFWALNQKDGSVDWKYKVGPHTKKKSIFSNPAFYKNLVIFGSYDGNIYALDRETGERKWICFEADWVGSSPAVADDLEMIFVGLEFGLFKKRGGIIAVDANTGKKIWSDTHPAYTHSSPLYIHKHKQVVIGSNDGIVRLYRSKDGKKLWEFITDGGKNYDTSIDAGFGDGDIKEGFAYDEKHDYLVFGSMDGNFYVLKRKTGELVLKHTCEFGIWSTSCIYNNRVYFNSLDKYVRCIDLSTNQLVFEVSPDSTRIFSGPVIINDKLYVGTNAARLHELDPETGKSLGYFQTLERITNSVVYNKNTDTYFLPTYANEIISLTRLNTLNE